MPRLPRRTLLNTATATSLALLAAILVLYVRGQFLTDQFQWVGEHSQLQFINRIGTLEISWQRDPLHQLPANPFESPPPPGFSHATTHPETVTYDPRTTNWGWLGVTAFATEHPQPGSTAGYLIVPSWAAALPCALLPLLWLRRHLRHRRLNPRPPKSLCPACHYDLRATPHRCPECGTIPPPPPPPQST